MARRIMTPLIKVVFSNEPTKNNMKYKGKELDKFGFFKDSNYWKSLGERDS